MTIVVGRPDRWRRAEDVKDDEVAPGDLEALRWLREARGRVDFGEPAGETQARLKSAGLVAPTPANSRVVRVELPYWCGSALGTMAARGASLSIVVDSLKNDPLLDGLDGDFFPALSRRDDFLKKPITKIGSADFTIEDLATLIRDYYDDENPCGGNLHCALDDGNVEDHHVQADLRESLERGDLRAALIAQTLLLMPLEDRQALYERGYGPSVERSWREWNR